LNLGEKHAPCEAPSRSPHCWPGLRPAQTGSLLSCQRTVGRDS
jgi:hypothetical protein